MAIQTYQQLEIWQRGMNLAEQIYDLTRNLPRDEIFGLSSQMRRAAVSVPANIAEGWGRQGSTEFQHFLRIAQGSLRELETHLLLAQRVELCRPHQVETLMETINILGKQILTLQRRLRRKQ